AGQIYTVKTLGAVKLYSAPNIKAEAPFQPLSLNDQVKVVNIDESPSLVRAGWVKVQLGTKDFWMPAWPIIGNSLLDESGREIEGNTQLQNCAKPRVVLGLTNFSQFRTMVPRFATNVKTRQTYKKSGIWTIDDTLTPT